jgi:formylglycine-generating enzyme required for sulfatase activity
MDSPQSGSSDHLQAESTSPAQSILGKDGNTMLFVPGGELEVSVEGLNGQRQTVQIQPFYLDEKMVTNHHFAEFLNEVKDGLTIEKGVVKNNKEIWFYLGKGTEPHEQIIYEHERFHLRNIDYAAHPAVRVTWYGAIAYARHYGKRLATEYEWDFAALGKYIKKSDSENRVESPLPAAVEQVGSSETHMMHMVSPSEKTYNLEGIGDRVKEWITKTKDYKDISYPSLVTESFGHVAVENKRFRYPWEAFSDVGFRCVLNTENVD